MDTNKIPRETYARHLMEAAAWLTHLKEREQESSAEFEEWLVANPRHEAAWRQVQRPWKDFTEHANVPEVIRLRRMALGKGTIHRRKPWARQDTRYASAAAIMMIVAGGLALWMVIQPDVYQTAVGERRTVALNDGSQISLDAQSEVRVRYSDHQREVRLVRGQARFDVVPDQARPFSVQTSDQKVLALGTAFTVDVLRLRTQVTLIEGRVLVLEEVSKGRFELKPGEQLSVTQGAAPVVKPVSLDVVTGWQQGQLFFDNEPLPSVLERVNRYSARAIEIVDEQTAALKVSGAFNAGDPDRFVQTITSYLPIEAQRMRNGGIRLSHR